jgi:hypothetical protein
MDPSQTSTKGYIVYGAGDVPAGGKSNINSADDKSAGVVSASEASELKDIQDKLDKGFKVCKKDDT